MSLFCNERRADCTGLAVVASLILGVVAAFLQITAVIAVTPLFLGVAFIVAAVYLAVLLVTAALNQRSVSCRCVCQPLAAILFGILLSVLSSVILLIVSFAATSVVGAIFVGILAFAVSLIFTATACLVRCLFCCDN